MQLDRITNNDIHIGFLQRDTCYGDRIRAVLQARMEDTKNRIAVVDSIVANPDVIEVPTSIIAHRLHIESGRRSSGGFRFSNQFLVVITGSTRHTNLLGFTGVIAVNHLVAAIIVEVKCTCRLQ